MFSSSLFQNFQQPPRPPRCRSVQNYFNENERVRNTLGDLILAFRSRLSTIKLCAFSRLLYQNFLVSYIIFFGWGRIKAALFVLLRNFEACQWAWEPEIWAANP